MSNDTQITIDIYEEIKKIHERVATGVKGTQSDWQLTYNAGMRDGLERALEIFRKHILK